MNIHLPLTHLKAKSPLAHRRHRNFFRKKEQEKLAGLVRHKPPSPCAACGLRYFFFVLLAYPKSTKRSSTAKSRGWRRRRSLSGHKRLRCLRRKKTRRFDCGGSAKSASGLCPRLWPSFAHPLRALAPTTPLSPRFSQCVRAGLWLTNSSRGCCFSTFCHQKVVPKVSARHLRRDRTTVLTERARKTTVCGAKRRAASTVAARQSPQAASALACGALRMLRCAARNDDFSYCPLAGRRPAYPRDVKMSDEEADAHRAPGTIVQKA